MRLRAETAVSGHPQREAPLRFAIAGYYGFGNVGDEAILASLVADLRLEYPGARFEIIGADYHRTLGGEDIRYVLWDDWQAVIQAVTTCDLLIVGGGGLFNSYLGYSPESLLVASRHFGAFTFSLPQLAYVLGKPCCLCAVGASHFDSPEALRHARLAVRLATICTVRDEATKRILDDGLRPPVQIRVTADPAFRLENANLPPSSPFAGIDSSMVAVALRNWSFSNQPGPWEGEIRRALGQFAARHGFRLLFIPFQSTQDLPYDLGRDIAIIERVRSVLQDQASCHVLEGVFTPSQISAVLAQCGMVVAMRLHAAILAVRNAVPFVALGYDKKVRHVLARCGLERFVVELEGLRAESLLHALESVYLEREAVRDELRKAGARMRRAAYDNMRAIARALGCRQREQKLPPTVVAALKELLLKQTLLLAERDRRLARVDPEAAAHRTALRRLISQGNLEDALHHLEMVLAVAPEDPEFLYLKAFCLHSLDRDLFLAGELYGRALSNGFDPYWVYAHRGQLNLKLQRWHEAIEDLEKACRDDRAPPVLFELLDQARAHVRRTPEESTSLPCES